MAEGAPMKLIRDVERAKSGNKQGLFQCDCAKRLLLDCPMSLRAAKSRVDVSRGAGFVLPLSRTAGLERPGPALGFLIEF